MRQTGIWLDKNEAHIVTYENGIEKNFDTITSNIENYNIRGGSGTRLKGGPQDVVHDRKYLEREKHQLKNYFNNITSHIKDTDALVIFGPADTNQKLSKELNDNYTILSSKIKGVEKADSMTKNQVKALVKMYYGLN